MPAPDLSRRALTSFAETAPAAAGAAALGSSFFGAGSGAAFFSCVGGEKKRDDRRGAGEGTSRGQSSRLRSCDDKYE
eukprot:31081-Pelagococcus_subviridis.AAC.5